MNDKSGYHFYEYLTRENVATVNIFENINLILLFKKK